MEEKWRLGLSFSAFCLVWQNSVIHLSKHSNSESFLFHFIEVCFDSRFRNISFMAIRVLGLKI